MNRAAVLIVTLGMAALAAASAPKHRTWLDRANAEPGTAQLKNPYEGNADSAKAGEKLYRRYCASCHGSEAEGVGRNPSLHSPLVKDASPGALFWLLRNGSLSRGMPSWSFLTPEMRWQLVTWLKTIDSGGEKH